MKIFIWIVFLGLCAGMAFQGHVIKYTTRGRFTIVDLEKAEKAQGQKIICLWYKAKYAEGTVLDLAASNTHWDFLFILCYVSLILLHSNDQMQKENWLFLNTLLRFNILLAILAGLCDVIENFGMLHNFRHVLDGRYYLETIWVTLPKFILAFFATFIILLSWIKSLFTRQSFLLRPH